MAKYIIDEERLLELLEAEAKLQCLENDGVDNWSWYMEGRIRFIANALDIPEEVVREQDIDFCDIAKADLECYEAF